MKSLGQLAEDLATIRKKVSIFENGIKFQMNDDGLELIKEINNDLTEIRKKIVDFKDSLSKEKEVMIKIFNAMRGSEW